MAYKSQKCGSQVNLIDEMLSHNVISNIRIANILKQVDRTDFVLKKDRKHAHDDRPIPIGFGATISAPHMHSFALEQLLDNLYPGSIVLDVGSGSGYLCACLAHLIIDNYNKNHKNNNNNSIDHNINTNNNDDDSDQKQPISSDLNEKTEINGKNPNGKVIGIEHIKELADQSIINLRRSKIHSEFLDKGIIEIKVGDARKEVPNILFDAIHVGAAAAPEVADFLATKLKVGGKMVIPVDYTKAGYQGFTLFEKKLKIKKDNKNKDINESELKENDNIDDNSSNNNKDYEIVSKVLQWVRYVPLTSEKMQRQSHKMRMQMADDDEDDTDDDDNDGNDSDEIHNENNDGNSKDSKDNNGKGQSSGSSARKAVSSLLNRFSRSKSKESQNE